MLTPILGGGLVAAYMAHWTTGVLAATLAADSPIAAIRCGPTQTAASIQAGTRRIFVQRLLLGVSSTVAWTAAQQFGLYLSRFSVANMAGGGTTNPFKIFGNVAATPDSVAKAGGAEGGEIRVSTTATLTTAGVTIDPVKLPVYTWSTVGPAEYPRVVVDFSDAPIRLDVGEGLALFNQIIWPAAGTAIVSAQLLYEEHIIG